MKTPLFKAITTPGYDGGWAVLHKNGEAAHIYRMWDDYSETELIYRGRITIEQFKAFAKAECAKDITEEAWVAESVKQLLKNVRELERFKARLILESEEESDSNGIRFES